MLGMRGPVWLADAMSKPRPRSTFLSATFAVMALAIAFQLAHVGLGLGRPELNGFVKDGLYTAIEFLAVGLCAARALTRRSRPRGVDPDHRWPAGVDRWRPDLDRVAELRRQPAEPVCGRRAVPAVVPRDLRRPGVDHALPLQPRRRGDVARWPRRRSLDRRRRCGADLPGGAVPEQRRLRGGGRQSRLSAGGLPAPGVHLGGLHRHRLGTRASGSCSGSALGWRRVRTCSTSTSRPTGPMWSTTCSMRPGPHRWP